MAISFCTANNENKNTFGDGARNVIFDENENEQRQSNMGVERPLAIYKHDEGLAQFFARPVKLYEQDWSVNSSIFDFHIWEEWVMNKRVANRLANYFGFRGNLKVKVVTNGNPFYFGRLQLSYYPLYGYYPEAINDTVYGSSQFGNAIIESQRQMLNICPSISSGIEMTLPWVYPADYFPLPGDASTSNFYNSSYNLGALRMRTLVALRSLMQGVGSATPKITLRIYAWMDDIELFGNTQRTTTGIVPQADEGLMEQAQAQKGAVSSKLTALAGVAHSLSAVPSIAPYAKPAEVAASTAARVAQLLGYSRPLNFVEPNRMQPTATTDYTHVVGSDNAIKLTLDPQCITTVDPQAVGAKHDELSFKSICGRYSLFHETSWDVTYSAGNIITSIPVYPHVTPFLAGEAASRYYPTAVGGVSNLFNYWKGTMVYRFDVIANSFHRGRLLVVYDPGGANPTAEENVQYAALVDISEAKSFEVEVKYNYHNGLKTIDMSLDGAGFDGVLNALEPYNGIISLYVGTELEIPNYVSTTTPSDVSILCYVKGGDDLCFGYPRRHIDGGTTYPRPNFEPEADEQLLSCCDLDTKRVMSVGFKDSTGSDLVYLGENIDSLRTLCKRYYTYIVDSPAAPPVDGTRTYYGYGMYPAVWGPPLSPQSVTGGTSNFVGMTPMAYTQLAFVGKRGSVRWKFFPIAGSTLATRVGDNVGCIQVQRAQSAWGLTTIGGRGTAPYSTTLIDTQSFDNSAGAIMSPLSLNPTLSWEMPYQNIHKFVNGRSNDGATDKPGSSVRDMFWLQGDSRSFPNRFALLTAAGEDFECLHFVGWPPYVHTAST